MERCDFSSIINVIRRYISEDRSLNQIDLLYEMFSSFINDSENIDFDFDNGLVCRWFNGQARISPRISGYYRELKNRNCLAADLEQCILPIMYDDAMAVQEIYHILIQDSSISDKVKSELTSHYSCEDESEEAIFLADVLCFGMERTFVKRDANVKMLLTAGKLSPVIKDFVFDSGIPKPCRHFVGRDRELTDLHNLLNEHQKVFLQGIAGIGKSELAKAYAKQYSKEYTNILYLNYSGDLQNDIADMDFADDRSEDSREERFRKHNRFLRTLKEDTLLIIDNFNTTASREGVLPVVLKYRCQVLFTTRSRFDQYESMDLEEISDRKALFLLVSKFFSEADTYSSIVEQIIEAVHSHTLAVELSARLLETGILDPVSLLNKLDSEKAALDTDDIIGMMKDGRSRKATYYNHIHTLFSLYQLSHRETDIMRNLSLVPSSGVRGRLLADWLRMKDMNLVNDLIEKGFVQSLPGHMIVLHPMLQEVAMEETKPSVCKCNILLGRLHEICLIRGWDISYYRQMFQTIETIIDRIEKDDISSYLLFLEDVFPYMDKYEYVQGMDLVLHEMSELLKDPEAGTDRDRALLLDYRAYREKDPQKAICMGLEALSLIGEIAHTNAVLVANIYSNLGCSYKRSGNYEEAKYHTEKAIRIMEQYKPEGFYDAFMQYRNYAWLLAETGESQKGLSILQKLSNIIEENNSDQVLDFATVQEDMGTVYMACGDVRQAMFHFQRAMEIYEKVYEAEPEIITAKKEEILLLYKQSGKYLKKNKFSIMY